MLFDDNTVLGAPAPIVSLIAVVYLGISIHGTDEMGGRGTDRLGVINITFNFEPANPSPAKAIDAGTIDLKFFEVERMTLCTFELEPIFIRTWKALIPNNAVLNSLESAKIKGGNTNFSVEVKRTATGIFAIEAFTAPALLEQLGTPAV